MKYGCKGKDDILLRLNYMVIHAPDRSPLEGGMNMQLAWATIEYGFQQLELNDRRPEVLAAVASMRSEIEVSRALFDKGDVIPACHKLQDVEEILGALKVKPKAR